jgi:hypothetical protein
MVSFRPFCEFDKSYQYRDNWEELHTLRAVYDFMHLPTAYMRGPGGLWVSFDDFPRHPLSFYIMVPSKRIND